MSNARMPDREKVLQALYGCSNVQSEFTDAVYVCPTCSYGKDDGRPCESLHPLLDDAYALLKAQEPRVMTLEEVDALGDDDIVWLECLYTVDGTNKTTIKPAIYQPDNSSPEEDGYYCVVSSWGKTGFYHKDSYMGDWRCWTSRPTNRGRW